MIFLFQDNLVMNSKDFDNEKTDEEKDKLVKCESIRFKHGGWNDELMELTFINL